MNNPNLYWSRRVDALAEQIPPANDCQFFGSEAYREYSQTSARNMVIGITDSLNQRGYKISDAEANRRADSITVMMEADPSMTACTNGDLIILGHESDLVRTYNTREERHFAIQGLRVHEVGHILFTDFPTNAYWTDQLSAGKWFPEPPKRITTPGGMGLNTELAKGDPSFCQAFAMVARQIENSLEDGFIEREITDLYGGLAAGELATVNSVLFDVSPTFEVGMKEKDASEFGCMMTQILLYAKFDASKEEGMDDVQREIFDECIDIIDEGKYERDSRKRLKCVNELCCVLYPLFEKYVKDMANKIQKQQNQQSNGQKGKSGKGAGTGSAGQGSSNQQGQAGNGQSGNNQQNGNQGQSGGTQNQSGDAGQQPSPEAIKKALEQAVKAAQKAAQQAGKSQETQNRNTQSVTQSAAKTPEAKAHQFGKQSPHQTTASSKGASRGESDLSAAELDVSIIEKNRKQEEAQKKANAEAREALKRETQEISKEIGTGVQVVYAEQVNENNIAIYRRLSQDLLGVTKNLERRLKTTIRDEENDDTVSGLPMGSRVEARLAYHQDGKIFSRKNFPRDNPRLAVGYLCDESGSMSRDAILASIRTGIIIQDLCERMGLPCYVCGFTTGYGGLQIIDYVDKNVDGKDKYRITGMSSRGGTPTAPAMQYMASKLRREQTERRLLIVSTDGCSSGGRDAVQAAIRKLQKDHIVTIGAGIGASRSQVQNEFGANFLDINDLDTMPKILCDIVRKNLA